MQIEVRTEPKCDILSDGFDCLAVQVYRERFFLPMWKWRIIKFFL